MPYYPPSGGGAVAPTHIFNERNVSSATSAVGLPNGSIVQIEGELYEINSAKTGVNSAFNDLGVNGAGPYNMATLAHFGISLDGTDQSTNLATFEKSNKPKNFSSGTVGVTQPYIQTTGQQISGEGYDSIIKALTGFPATYTYDWVDDGSPTSMPCPIMARPFIGGLSNRNGVYKLFLDGDGIATVGMYIGVGAHLIYNDIMSHDIDGPNFVFDGIQNTDFSNFTAHTGTDIRFVNQTYNCRITNLSSTDLTDGFLYIGPDTNYPASSVFGAEPAPRNLTFAGGIHERVKGSPAYLIKLVDAERCYYYDAEFIFSDEGGSPANVTAFCVLEGCSFTQFYRLRFQGWGNTVNFPASMSIFDVSDSLGTVIVDQNIKNFFTSEAYGIRSVVRHRDNSGDLLIENLTVSSVVRQKLIESENPDRVQYIPTRSAGAWSARPTADDWIEAEISWNVSVAPDEVLPITKQSRNFKTDTLTAGTASGSNVLSVPTNVSNGAIPGDQVGVTLDDGTFQWTYVTAVSSGSLTIQDNLRSAAASGNAVEIAGRWYQSNGLHYFGEITYTDGDTTPLVAGIEKLVVTNSAATTITNFVGGQSGQVLIVEATDANTTINNGANILTLTGAATALSANVPVTFVRTENFKWRQI